MADNFPAKIWIGGKVSKAQLKGLVEALHKDGASHEYGCPEIPIDCTEWKELVHYVDDGLLTLMDDQAHNGEFELTEKFCVENSISFDRNSDHYMEYDAENSFYRPDMRVPMVTFADSRGDEVVSGEPVRQAMSDLKEYLDSEEHDCTTIAGIIHTLSCACPELPDSLAGFEVVE